MHGESRTVPPPHSSNQSRSVPLTGLWQELLAQQRKQVLRTLSRMVVQNVVAPPAERKVAHDDH